MLARGGLVGRTADLGKLHAALRRARSGEAACILLSGAPGIGKTRLADEFVARCGDRVLALTARAHSLAGAHPFGLFVEALEGHLRQLRPVAVRGLCGGLTDDAAAVLPSAAVAAGGSPRRLPSRPRVLEAMTVLCGNLARQHTVLVFLDDLHLADASSLEVLNYLVRALRRSPVLFIAAARPGELSASPAGDLVLRLEQDGLLRRLELSALGTEELAQLAAAASPDGRAPEALVAWLESRSRGVPLFAIGLLHALADEGADWARPNLMRLPEELTERVRSQMGGVSGGARDVLQMLAVLGGRASLSQLPGLTGLGSASLSEALEPLIRGRLVSEIGSSREPVYEIAHPLVQEALYGAIPAPRRRELHRRIAVALLESDRLSDAAPHFARSAAPGDETAIEVLCRALRHASQREALREASASLSDLVEILPGRHPRWLEVLEYVRWQANWLIDHKFEVGETAVRTAIAAIQDVAATSDDVGLRAEVRYCESAFLGWDTGDVEHALVAARESGQLFRDAGRYHDARLSDDMAAFLVGLSGDLAGQEAAARQVLAEAERESDQQALASVLTTLGYALLLQGREEEAERVVERAIALVRERGIVHRSITNWALLAQIRAFAGRLADADAALRMGASDASAYPDTILPDISVRVRWMEGDLHAALARADEAMSWCRGGLGRRRAWAIAMAAIVAGELARTDAARDLLERSASTYGDSHWYAASYHCVWARGFLAWQEGRFGDALSALTDAADGLDAMRALTVAALVECDRAQVAVEAGDAPTAATAASRLQRIAAELSTPLYDAIARLGAGLTRLSRDPGQAEAEAREAAAAFEATGFRLFHARALEVVAKARLMRGENARAALQAAVEAYTAIDAVWRRERLLRLEGGRARTALAEGLTPRERDVARLAVRGLTAREIGARLGIGHRTVETHLGSAYAKLGLRSRVELASRAAELGVEAAQ